MFTEVHIPITSGSDLERKLKTYLQDKVRSIRQGLKDLHENRVVRWRKNYEGIPVTPTREFPFHNASNLVVPIIAIHSDTLLARVMSAVIKTQPPWNARVLAGFEKEAKLNGVSTALEQFLQYVAYEPTELDLYRVYHEWMGETIRYGTSTLKVPIEKRTEDYVVASGASGKGIEYSSRVTYLGPRPEKIRFSDFGIEPSAKTVTDAKFKYHRIPLQKDDLEFRAQRGIYKKAVVDAILSSPDRTTPDKVRQSQEQDAGAKTVSGYGFAEWDIYECWFTFPINDKHWVKCIVWYHEKTNNILRAVFSQYPEDPFISARLFYRDDAFHGYGFCEMLEPIAEELSTMHNQRRDNMTVSTTKFFLVDPDSKLHEGYRIFPSAMLPGLKDELTPIEMGTPQQITIDEERLVLELAEKRTGVSAPIQGAGSGFNTKRGVYTAMGTLSLLQEGNTRTDLNITDMRDAHTRLGRLICREYEMVGLGDRTAAFGELAPKIEAALSAMAAGQVILPITAATASINREVEKQNDLMMVQVLNRHYGQIVQMLQSLADPRISDPNAKRYTISAMNAADFMMKTVMRHFGYDEVEKLVPDSMPVFPGTPPQGGGMPQVGAPQAQPPQLPPGIPSMMPPSGGVQ